MNAPANHQPRKRPETVFETEKSFEVVVYPERGGQAEHFDFGKLGLGHELEAAFARGFARATGAGGSRRTIESAKTTFWLLRAFATSLNEVKEPPKSILDLRPQHLAPFLMNATKRSAQIIYTIRIVLRSEPTLPDAFRDRLFLPLTVVPGQKKISSYSEADFRALRRAARHTVRTALARVRAAEAEVATWRTSPDASARPTDGSRGYLLTLIDRTGDLPRDDAGKIHQSIAYDGSGVLLQEFFPSLAEIAAIGVLMQSLTGENWGVIRHLTTEHSRSDDQLEEAPELQVRALKSRRGSKEAHMDLTLTARPPWQEDVEHSSNDDFTSPFGLYKIAEELCSNARRLAASNRLLVGYSHTRKNLTHEGLGLRALGSDSARYWNSWQSSDDERPGVDSMRLRLTYLEFTLKPTAQTSETMARDYVIPNRGNRNTNRAVVAGALDREVARIRASHRIQALSITDVREASANPARLAKELDISEEKLVALLSGRLDTIATACVDHKDSPFSKHGETCRASFLLCLGCPNARSEPRLIPVQSLMLNRIRERKGWMPPDEWVARFEQPAEQLEDLLARQGADPAGAERAATSDDARRVEAVLDGRYDLR